MNERRQDFDLLQRFTRDGEQSAFADVVRRHLDLVFATALRKVEDRGAAQEVAQNVFAVLARKAWRFAPDDSLPAWLHKTALLESKSWLRGELRRRRREETAAALGTTMNTPENQPAFHALVPLLDDALLSLREKDRTALLLRFYESRSLRDVGAAIGGSEDTAQKRVQSALEKLTEFFKRRGFKTVSVAAATAALQHTATSVSAGAASAVVSAALQFAPPALVGLSALLARLASLTRLQTAAACVVLAAVPVGWKSNKARGVCRELTRIETQLAPGQTDAASLQSELERLRANVGRLEQSAAQANEAATRAAVDAQAFADWKQKLRSKLLAADYRWDDDSPFVRIPKAVLSEVAKQQGYAPFAGGRRLSPMGLELLGMTASEQQSVEESLQAVFADADAKVPDLIQETNQPSPNLRSAGNTVAVRSFAFSLPAAALKPFEDQVLVQLRDLIGDDRWPLVEAKPPKVSRLSGFVDPSIQRDDNGALTVYLGVDIKLDPPSSIPKGGVVYALNMVNMVGPFELTMFLPEGDAKRTVGIEGVISSLDRAGVSRTAAQRALAWLEAEAIARLVRKEKP
jgi:RNA polymerase sigma factor (sigma-70 family)